MFKRKTALIWLGILVLSGLFLMGQESWPPPPCQDADMDGYGAGGLESCPNLGIDCDDSNAGIHPGAVEIPANGIDENCDGIDAANPDLDMLVDFLDDDDALMAAFFIEAPNPGPGTDVTIEGAIGGSCHWTIGYEFLSPIVTYDYQGYNESGLIMNGVRSGQMSLLQIWILGGTLELSGTWSGWIYYQMPMNGMSGPILDARTWRVCNYDNGCTNLPGDTTGLEMYNPGDLP